MKKIFLITVLALGFGAHAQINSTIEEQPLKVITLFMGTCPTYLYSNHVVMTFKSKNEFADSDILVLSTEDYKALGEILTRDPKEGEVVNIKDMEGQLAQAYESKAMFSGGWQIRMRHNDGSFSKIENVSGNLNRKQWLKLFDKK